MTIQEIQTPESIYNAGAEAIHASALSPADRVTARNILGHAAHIVRLQHTAAHERVERQAQAQLAEAVSRQDRIDELAAAAGPAILAVLPMEVHAFITPAQEVA